MDELCVLSRECVSALPTFTAALGGAGHSPCDTEHRCTGVGRRVILYFAQVSCYLVEVRKAFLKSATEP